MKIIIHRGTHEIGGTLLEVKTESTRLLIDAGYPLLLNGKSIDDDISKRAVNELLKLGVLPPIEGLYQWDQLSFDAIIISHAHIDHYGLMKYINTEIPVYLSAGTQKLIEITQLFQICDTYLINFKIFKMYKLFKIKDILIKPYLMDHSAFDAAAFELSDGKETIIYSGDFRGHGRKAVCLDRFITSAMKHADALITEGTMLGRLEEQVITEDQLEDTIVNDFKGCEGPILFQSSSQNIDRIVSFYKAAQRMKRIFLIDIYTANVLYELRQLENNHLPYPSIEFANIKVFYPYILTQKVFNKIGEEYAKRFSAFHMPKERLKEIQNKVIMMVRPSMLIDVKKCELHDGVFIYSMWQGYRDSPYQQKFESFLMNAGFQLKALHTSGHASVADLKRLITGLDSKRIIPIHTMIPEAFKEFSDKVELMDDGIEFQI